MVSLSIPIYAEENTESNTSVITKDGLEFVVSTDRQFYRESEAVHISWKITNISLEDIGFTKVSSCSDGFMFDIFDSTLHKVNAKLTETALLIPENDPNLSKFDSKQFYGDILYSIKTEPDKQVNILMLTSGKKQLEQILKNEFGVSKVSKATTLSFVTAQVNVKDVPQIAKLDLVRRIVGGGGGICTSAITEAVLKPNQSIENNFSWSQLVQVQDRASNPQRILPGFYSIDVRFNNITNCVTVGIVGDESLSSPRPPCGIHETPNMVRIATKHDLQCKDGFQLAQKIRNSEPVCIKSESLKKLLELGLVRENPISSEQCTTVMHEQIVQKKIDGKLRLQKIQVPMKICSFKVDAEYLGKLATYPKYDNLPKLEYSFVCQNATYTIPYTIVNGELENVQPSKSGPSGKYFEIFIKPTDRGILTLELSNKLINTRNFTSVDFTLSGVGKLKTSSMSTSQTISLKIPFEKDTKKIDVYPSTLSACLPTYSIPKIPKDLLFVLNSDKERLYVSVDMLGRVGDFRPTKSSGEYYGMPELTQEQRDQVVEKRVTHIKELQKDIVQFITNNGGIVKSQSRWDNELKADVPTSLVKQLTNRTDVRQVSCAEFNCGIKIRNVGKVIPVDIMTPVNLSGTITSGGCGAIDGTIVVALNETKLPGMGDLCKYNGKYFQIDVRRWMCTMDMPLVMDTQTNKIFRFNDGCSLPHANDGSWKRCRSDTDCAGGIKQFQ